MLIGCRRLVVTHQWFVVAGTGVGAMLQLPTATTEISETGEVSAEIGTGFAITDRTWGLLQVRIDLNLLPEIHHINTCHCQIITTLTN